MKALYFLILLFMVGACKTQTRSVISNDKTTMENSETIKSHCPEDGTCKVVVHTNKNLEIIDDGSMSTIYPKIVEGNNMVVEYTYFRPGPEGIADGNYSETIYFEIPARTTNLVKENGTLADVNLLFGKQGYRNAGFYPVTEGRLVVEKTENTVEFELKFKMDKTSHVISNIQERIEF